MASDTVHNGAIDDETIMSVGPLELPHSDAACLLGPQRDQIMSDTGIICHVRNRHGTGSEMTLLMKGPKSRSAADFEKARLIVCESVRSNFQKGVRNHNDARAIGLLAPQYGGEGGQSTKTTSSSRFQAKRR